jgi:hypothetical protein
MALRNRGFSASKDSQKSLSGRNQTMIDGKLADSENCVLASGCRAERRVGGQGCWRQVNDSYARKFFLSARCLPITPVGSYGRHYLAI